VGTSALTAPRLAVGINARPTGRDARPVPGVAALVRDVLVALRADLVARGVALAGLVGHGVPWEVVLAWDASPSARPW
jgi:hypothetical protein